MVWSEKCRKLWKLFILNTPGQFLDIFLACFNLLWIGNAPELMGHFVHFEYLIYPNAYLKVLAKEYVNTGDKSLKKQEIFFPK